MRPDGARMRPDPPAPGAGRIRAPTIGRAVTSPSVRLAGWQPGGPGPDLLVEAAQVESVPVQTLVPRLGPLQLRLCLPKRVALQLRGGGGGGGGKGREGGRG
jgi:hypothetical protein